MKVFERISKEIKKKKNAIDGYVAVIYLIPQTILSVLFVIKFDKANTFSRIFIEFMKTPKVVDGISYTSPINVICDIVTYRTILLLFIFRLDIPMA